MRAIPDSGGGRRGQLWRGEWPLLSKRATVPWGHPRPRPTCQAGLRSRGRLRPQRRSLVAESLNDGDSTLLSRASLGDLNQTLKLTGRAVSPLPRGSAPRRGRQLSSLVRGRKEDGGVSE